ncbi:MAG: alpha/beta hydrolase [Cyclobacteriaceae bacterium]|nr:alpha/beta hydrolase [Cyclobacteriaceae bacterium]
MFVEQERSKLHYRKEGNGSMALLLFHGFGQDHHIFKSFVQVMGDCYTVYSFDLYFHGKSEWGHGEKPLEKSDWKETIQIFLSDNAIETFSLGGFSMGGKFALATLEAFPTQTKEIFLIAPDGIKTSFWYSLATYPLALRKLFKSIVDHPALFNSIVHTLQQLNLIKKGLGKFAAHQMNTEEKRRKVYFSWVVFRHLKFNLDDISNLINTYQIDTTVLVGKYDEVIRPEQMHRFLKKLNKHRFEILETGHNGVLMKSVDFFLSH